MKGLKNIFSQILSNQVSKEAYAWLEESKNTTSGTAFNSGFAAIPRRTGKALVSLDEATKNAIAEERPGLEISGWSVDRLARVWLLMHLDTSNRDEYIQTIEALFRSAEVNELVALYSALPVLEWPEAWEARCSEGIRNNIADVLSAIMCNNPYPSENLAEPAWNQLVLKAFFTDKPVNTITGLDKRRNARLAATLSDYAHERWAAHRSVNPLLWRCVAPFIDSDILPDIKKIAASENDAERAAAALASFESNFSPARELVPSSLKDAIEAGRISWNTVSEKMNNYVLQ